MNFFDSLGLYPDCESIILDTFNKFNSWSEERSLLKDYGFTFIVTGLSVGPNLDPRKPKQMPISLGVSTEVWWSVKEILAIKMYETIKVFQNLRVFCTEKLTDECGNEREFSTSFETIELASETTKLTDEKLEIREQLIKLLFRF